jgi:hypothetical protein
MPVPWQSPNSTRRGILQPGRDDVLTHDDPERGLDHGGVFDHRQYEGQPLENWLQHYVAAVAGIEASLVRPRWQKTPPNIPDFNTPCWLSIGIIRKRQIAGGQWGAVLHYCDNPNGPGHDELQRWEDIELLCSFYGPECEVYSENLFSGLLGVWQNRAVLRSVYLALVEVGEQIRAPELVKQQWLDRVDRTVYFRRVVMRNYPVFNLLSASGSVRVNPGTYQVPFSASPPLTDSR